VYRIDLRSLAAREPRNAIEAAGEQELPSEPLAYLTRNLDLLGHLGVTVLQLAPPFPMSRPSPLAMGDTRATLDLTGVDREYGTVEQLRGLVRAAHGHGFRVLLEFPPGVVGREHPWVHAHPDWFPRDASGGAAPVRGNPALAALDLRAPAVRAALKEALRFWLALEGEDEEGLVQGVDGFRVDDPGCVPEAPSFWQEAWRECAALHPRRELLFIAGDTGRTDPRTWTAAGFHAVDDDALYRLFLAYYAVDETGVTRVQEPGDPSADEGLASVQLAYLDRGLAGAVERILADSRGDGAEGASAWWVRFADHPALGRGVYRFGEGGALAVNQLQFLLDRTLPQLLTGQEFGSLTRPALARRVGTFPGGRRVLLDGKSLDVPGIELEGNLFARGRQQRLGWYAFFQDLIALRRQTPELVHGGFRLLEAGEKCAQHHRTVIAFERKHRDGVVRCAVNLGPEPRRLAHASLFRHPPLYGALNDGELAPFTSIVVRSA
jgi:glycosidase